MQTIELTVRNPLGLHGRPAAAFVKTAAGFKSKVLVENVTRGAAPVNAKSILTILTAAVKKDHQIRLTIEGEDEEAAARALTDAVNSGLGEAVD